MFLRLYLVGGFLPQIKYFIEGFHENLPVFSRLVASFKDVEPVEKSVKDLTIKTYETEEFVKVEISSNTGYLISTNKNSRYQIFYKPREETDVDFGFMHGGQISRVKLKTDTLYPLQADIPHQFMVSGGTLESFLPNREGTVTDLGHNILICTRYEDDCVGLKALKDRKDTEHRRKILDELYDESCNANYRKCPFFHVKKVI